MKTVALTILGIACVLSGQYIAFVLSLRVRLLEKIQLMLSSIENSISFLGSPAADIMAKLSENRELKELRFIDACYEKMKNGANFPNAWSESMAEKSNVRFLKNEDVAVLASFGERFGTTDIAGQVSNCRIHSELIKDRLCDARSERERYASLACGMGAVCGVGVIIMMI